MSVIDGYEQAKAARKNLCLKAISEIHFSVRKEDFSGITKGLLRTEFLKKLNEFAHKEMFYQEQSGETSRLIVKDPSYIDLLTDLACMDDEEIADLIAGVIGVTLDVTFERNEFDEGIIAAELNARGFEVLDRKPFPVTYGLWYPGTEEQARASLLDAAAAAGWKTKRIVLSNRSVN